MVSALRIIIERSYYQLVETAWNGECFLCFHDITYSIQFWALFNIFVLFGIAWLC